MTDHVTPRFKSPAKPRERGWKSTLPRASKPINQISERQKTIESTYVEQKRLVHERSGRKCEMPDGHHVDACRGRAQEVHHVKERSLGRDDSMSNLRDLSIPCHVWCTVNTVAAKALFADHPLSEDT